MTNTNYCCTWSWIRSERPVMYNFIAEQFIPLLSNLKLYTTQVGNLVSCRGSAADISPPPATITLGSTGEKAEYPTVDICSHLHTT